MNTSKTLEICSNLNNILEQYGNINFLSKDDLYSLIDYIRNCFEIKIDEIFNVVQFCQNNFSEIINYDFHKFNDKKNLVYEKYLYSRLILEKDYYKYIK